MGSISHFFKNPWGGTYGTNANYAPAEAPVGTKSLASPPGFEPGPFGLEVQRAILCANGTPHKNFLLNPGMMLQ